MTLKQLFGLFWCVGCVGGIISGQEHVITGWYHPDKEAGCFDASNHSAPPEHNTRKAWRCTGKNITTIPYYSYMDGAVELTIENAPNIVQLHEKNFAPYSNTLVKLLLSDLSRLRTLPRFARMVALQEIVIQKAFSLVRIESNVFENLPMLRTLRILHTRLEHFPSLHQVISPTNKPLDLIDFDSNRIQFLEAYSVQVTTATLILNHNHITVIENFAFNQSRIGTLRLRGNIKLTTLGEYAFSGMVHGTLQEIDLSETSIDSLPTDGLENIQTLRLVNTWSLMVFPSVYHFSFIQKAELTYPCHCCAIKFPNIHNPQRHQLFAQKMQECKSPPHEESEHDEDEDDDFEDTENVIFVPEDNSFTPNYQDRGEFQYERQSRKKRFSPTTEVYGRVVTGVAYDFKGMNINTSDDFVESRVNMNEIGIFQKKPGYIKPNETIKVMCGRVVYHQVNCTPMPDAFNPCEDVMGTPTLRVAVWFVVVAAVLGNLAVMIVLMSSRFRMSVSKFLMCNLAFADFCMGAYLLLIAAVDLKTIGAYFNSAMSWQQGSGCQIAGFLTVFASELSIFTLLTITLERWYAITFSVHLNRRLKLRTMAKVMACGWAYAAVVASLPLMGVSSYSKTSICLPMENSSPLDRAYLCTLLSINGLAFLVICACYAKMYHSIAGQQLGVYAAGRDTTVAKRMALLVFTDFACWAPTAFFGLTAVAGYPLIDINQSKILLVFFYPLNSCANPFLYAILTKQYRRDLFILLARYGLCTSRASKYKDASSGEPKEAHNCKRIILRTHPSSYPVRSKQFRQWNRGRQRTMLSRTPYLQQRVDSIMSQHQEPKGSSSIAGNF